MPRGARLPPVALALLALGAARAQTAEPPGIVLRNVPELRPPARGDAQKQLPVIVSGQEIRGRPDLETVVEGNAEFRRGGVLIRADRLSYDSADDLAQARGNVRISSGGNVYSGPELQLHVQRFEGFFSNPNYFFGRTGAGGSARRVDFIDDQRAVATGATYSSCPADGSGGPAWLLETGRVKMDFEANEGVAEDAVLRFYGVPILAAPVLSFPLTDARKSGWLPPSINLDSKSGLQFSIPYYWNIAPNRDATITPMVSAKRGVGGELEFRYLEPQHHGSVNLHGMPNDRLTGRARYSLNLAHDSTLPGEMLLSLRSLHVSDDEYWKDFPRAVPSLTPRLLSTDLQASRPFGDEWSAYARVQRWQVLQDTENAIVAPYQREPQVGLRWRRDAGNGLMFRAEGEVNRFSNPEGVVSGSRPAATRAHLLGSIARPFATPGWSVTPKFSFNAASYSFDQALPDGRRSASRVIPTFSVDSAWVLERDAGWFGRSVRQTLEPRLLYVNTPYRDQIGPTALFGARSATDPAERPTFDSAGKDFNFESLFTENEFSGVDRVSDTHQLTAGVTTRFLDPDTGAEMLRLGLAQRYLFRDQKITRDEQQLTQRFSDVLLLASTSLVPHWQLDASLQYSPEINRSVRSILGARYSPGPYRTFGLTYRLARAQSEQVELAWQWPLYGPGPQAQRGGPAAGGSCRGNWYGVGRINYSMRDSRVTDSVIGFEYDAGCWIGRVVAERLSTGRSEATTRLLLQLELVGLSRLGSNPLQVLKDNIPGYRLLREERGNAAPTTLYD